MADGLGHGELAREASARATAVVQQNSPGADLEELLRECHSALQGTRGAVMAVMRLDRLSCNREIIGLAEKSYALSNRAIEAIPIRSGDVVLAYSDGLTSTLDISEDAVLLREHPLIIADRVLTTFGRDSDDALVLVAR